MSDALHAYRTARRAVLMLRRAIRRSRCDVQSDLWGLSLYDWHQKAAAARAALYGARACAA
jgi:hypothetical protein